MKQDGSHIKRIRVVSNTHWDREFRRSFERTRASLVAMMDRTLDILEQDPDYHSFTLDGHAIVLDDYIALRPQRRPLAERLVREGRLIIGPWYTLPEQFSIGAEALVRNFLFGRERVLAWGGKPPTVAYTPASWGQTGQLPKILSDFGCRYMMFYRGVSHDECDAEWVWEGSDGSRVLASRFALYARYNWYYQVHRPARTGRDFSKDYRWGEFTETPVRIADGLSGPAASYFVDEPHASYDPEKLAAGIESMVAREGAHFTTDLFLGMNGHDISGAYALESRQIADARRLLGDRWDIRHTSLEEYWQELEAALDIASLPVLKGERRSYLRKGMWTFLFPGTISARTYLKIKDRQATRALVALAEPMAVLAGAGLAATIGAGAAAPWPSAYLHRGWDFLLQNHTHDANGGCAPDVVCADMEYRYRAATDLATVVQEEAMRRIAREVAPPADQKAVEGMQHQAGTTPTTLVVFNTAPRSRRGILRLDLELPRNTGNAGFAILDEDGKDCPLQGAQATRSSTFVDSDWEVPVILETLGAECWADLGYIPALGWSSYRIVPRERLPRPLPQLAPGGAGGIAPDTATLRNGLLTVTVNANGTVDILDHRSGRLFRGLNYLRDEGEAGNAWKHEPPDKDRIFDTRSLSAVRTVAESGLLVGAIECCFRFPVPTEGIATTGRSAHLVELPVTIRYELRQGEDFLRIQTSLDNRALDHRLRACFPAGFAPEVSVADSHFDVVTRPVAVPDSSTWAETAWGTQPMQTFIAVCETITVPATSSRAGLALMPAGIFEYEVMEDGQGTIALTLLQGCRIRLAVSEEKQTELPDKGIQCPGPQVFTYAVRPFPVAPEMPPPQAAMEAGLTTLGADWDLPFRAVLAGSGTGRAPGAFSLLSLSDPLIVVDAVKRAEEGTSWIIRLHNPGSDERNFSLFWNSPAGTLRELAMDESPRPVQAAGGVAGTTIPSSLLPGSGCAIQLKAGPKTIITLGIEDPC
jgi:hypothetical protein